MRIFLSIFLAFSFLIPVAESQQLEESGIIKIRVDLDSANVRIDNKELNKDSYGNPLAKEAWFIINALPGEHLISILAKGYDSFDTVMTIIKGEVSTVDLHFLPLVSLMDAATVKATSVPESLKITIDDSPAAKVTPFVITLPSGRHTFKAFGDSIETIGSDHVFAPKSSVRMKFLPASAKPKPLNAEDLNLEFANLNTPRNEEEAKKLGDKFDNLAQSFAIIPTGQGILARLVLGKEDAKQADYLIAAGVGLTVTTYVLGKILSSKKLKEIKAANIKIEQENFAAKKQNDEVEKAVESKNAEAMDKWKLENEEKGKVEIEVE